MKKYIYFFGLVLLFTSVFTFSQTSDSSSTSKNSLQKHSWSLQFAVGSNFTIAAFDGLMFSLKYHFSDRSAFRFGVGILGGSNNGVQETVYGSTPLLNDNENIVLFGSFLCYPNPGKNFILFFGAGPRLGFKHTLRQNASAYDSLNQKYSNETTSWATGLQLNFGVEWFATKSLSLFAEYLAYATYGKTYTHISDYNVGWNYNTTDWYFNGTSARLGISVYF